MLVDEEGHHGGEAEHEDHDPGHIGGMVTIMPVCRCGRDRGWRYVQVLCQSLLRQNERDKCKGIACCKSNSALLYTSFT